MNLDTKRLSPQVLLVDVGNTRIKWKIPEQGGVAIVADAPHVHKDISELLSRIWGDIVSAPRRVLISNVAGESVTNAMSAWMGNHWGIEGEFLRSQKSGCGVANGYSNPKQLGIDRWLTLIAARQSYADSVCIVDAGTALTVDVLDRSGQHHGGLILPGLNLMRESLQMRTKIPQVASTEVDDMLADNTSSAVASASLHASAALIDRVIRQWEVEYNERLKVLVTGSDGGVIASALEFEYQLESDLVMQGLELIATLDSEIETC